MSFDLALKRTVNIEGEFSDNKNDSGGATKYGITEAVAREFGYVGAMADMPMDTARAIYRANYWTKLNLDLIDDSSPDIAEELFDTGVNMGVEIAGQFLQTALNAFNKEGTLYADIKVDGDVGGMTVGAFKSFLKIRGSTGELVLMRALNAQQGQRYLNITKARPTQEDFVFGWFLNRVSFHG